MAANPDIAKAVTEPDIDFKQGTALTQISLEALRLGGCKRVLYSSGSGVYGDVGHEFVAESHSNMMPISTYGASKLGCEALISSYCHMFGMKASVFRFGNVVGGRQTHGVGFDFIKYLLANSRELQILGDGGQSKPYVHVSDVVRAMLMVLKLQTSIFEVFNVAPEDFVSVKEIASIVLNEMHIQDTTCKLHFTGGDRGWKGDVPIVRLDTSKIRKWGWSNLHSSADAVRLAVREMLGNAKRLYE